MSRIAIFILCALTALSFAPKNDRSPAAFSHVAFKNGEKLKFTLHYGFIHAGEAVLELKDDYRKIAGRDHFHLAIQGYSFPFFDMFYKVRDYYDSYIDKETLLPTVFIRNIWEDDYKKKESYLFNHQKSYVESGDKKFDIPANTFDIASAFYYLRCLDYSNLKEGDVVPVKSFFDEEMFPLGVEYVGKKAINTKFGKVRCLVFYPKLIEGRIFKDQRDMILFVSDDMNHIPVRIQSGILVGNVKADLIEYSGLKYGFSSLVK